MRQAAILATVVGGGLILLLGYALYAASAQDGRVKEAAAAAEHDGDVALAAADEFLGKASAPVGTTPYDLRRGAEQAKAGVSRLLKDPSSPRWGDISTIDGVHFCGSVAGVNSFGAYGDHVQFVAVGNTATMPASKDDWSAHCVASAGKPALLAAH